MAQKQDVLAYIGSTKQPLNTRLHAHFFNTSKVQQLDINQVSKIEFAAVQTAADMYVFEMILINRYKPIFNRNNKADDELTMELPDLPFFRFESHLMEKWKKEIRERDFFLENLDMRKRNLLDEHRKRRIEIFSNKDLSAEEKANMWTAWLVQCYEPAWQELDGEYTWLLNEKDRSP